MGFLRAAKAAGATDQDPEKLIIDLSTDVARSGAAPRFSAEQVAGTIALARAPPADSGLPVSHWTPSALARAAAKRGLVESISARQVDRFLSSRTAADFAAHIEATIETDPDARWIFVAG